LRPATGQSTPSAPCTQSSAAALKLAVHPSRSRRDVLHIILELHRRLEDSTDWLVNPLICYACLCWEESLLLCAGWQVAKKRQQQEQRQQQAPLRCPLLPTAACPLLPPSSADRSEDADHAAPTDAGERARFYGGAGAVQVSTQAVQVGLPTWCAEDTDWA
jgi:hypothetical protein